ncbi:tetratricopeptide repeat protein [Oceanobacillus halophilus]|uniref:Tetratricopeptide repeat protein n=1 Tax=Oceanobacillus halophilus TaxID=930130 RepID=A0A495ADC4_9BACI|nr:tetratricopeptide repeat protein [Oceanobacillus halophilus]RKQ37971.1 tetratricopeptide repeat protein [Oceanobacillus halophilus]
MSKMDIFNLYENIKDHINETNKNDLEAIVEEFKHGRYAMVLSATTEFRKNHEIDKELARTLSLIDATCHSQIGEEKRAAGIIKNLYEDSVEKPVDDLIIYADLAFMCDYKLARKIMSDAVKQIENEEALDKAKAAHAYLVLGEAEEKLEKFIRAIKYFKTGLTYYQEESTQNMEMIVFLHFKLGALHSLINETDKAIEYLKETIKLTEENDIDKNDIEIRINSLVSLAKMYGSKEEHEKAITYLQEAIPLLEGSSLENKLVHAEAFTEMAFNYFDQSMLDEAVPYYEKAITMHLGLPNYSPRQLGMIYMQYAYSLEHKEQPDKSLAARNYEQAIEQLEKTTDIELLENALADVIAFFGSIDNPRKKRLYENKFVKMDRGKGSLPH